MTPEMLAAAAGTHKEMSPDGKGVERRQGMWTRGELARIVSEAAEAATNKALGPHLTTHAWVEKQMAKEARREERWEKLQTMLAFQAIMGLLALLGWVSMDSVREWVKQIAKASKIGG